MPKNENILSLENLKVRFYTYEGIVEAIDGIDLQLRNGETLGLVGETGCGKSVTSLATLVLVPPPGRIESGHAFFKTRKSAAVDLFALDEKQLLSMRGRDMAMIFQEPRSALNPVYTVEEQITEVFLHHRIKQLAKESLEEIEKDLTKKSWKGAFQKIERRLYTTMLNNPNALSLRVLSKIPVARRYRNRIKNEAAKHVVKILGEMKIPDPARVAKMHPYELSGGMAQRVVIAMALGCNPELLIADEPTTNLDVTVQAQILELIRDLKGKFGSSILYITHDLGVVAELCDRVAVMYAGDIVELADVEAIYKRPLHPYTQGLLGSIPQPGKEFISIKGEVPSLIKPPKGCRFNPRCQKTTESCLNTKPKFVEVEKEHYVKCHLYSEER